MADRDTILTLAEAAREFSLPPTWLKARTDQGQVAHLKVGHKIYFSRHALEATLVELASAPVARGAPP